MAIDEVVSNLQNKAFSSSTVQSGNLLEFWAIECLVDKLFLHLVEVKETINKKDKFCSFSALSANTLSIMTLEVDYSLLILSKG